MVLCWACAFDVGPSIRVRPFGTVGHPVRGGGRCAMCGGERPDDGNGRTQLLCEVRAVDIGTVHAFIASHRRRA